MSSETYTVRTAYNGEQALQYLDSDVNVVLLDRRMPDISGNEVLEAIRSQEYTCRVAMVTAVRPTIDVIEMGFDEYVVKPVSEPELRDTVDRLVSRTAYDQQLQEFFALVSKQAVLETARAPQDLENSEEYITLKQQIGQERDRLDALLDELDDADIRTLLPDHQSSLADGT